LIGWLDGATRSQLGLTDLTVALRGDLDLVHPDVRHHEELDPQPWYEKKATASFLAAFASLRRVLWAGRIMSVSSSEALPREIIDGLLDDLATAA